MRAITLLYHDVVTAGKLRIQRLFSGADADIYKLSREASYIWMR